MAARRGVGGGGGGGYCTLMDSDDNADGILIKTLYIGLYFI